MGSQRKELAITVCYAVYNLPSSWGIRVGTRQGVEQNRALQRENSFCFQKRGAPRCLRRVSQVQAHLLLVSSLPHSTLPPGLGGVLFGKAAKARPFRTQSVSAHSQRSQNLYFLWVGRAFLPSIQNSIFCAIIEPYVPELFGKLLISLRAVWTEVKKLGNFMPVHSL